MNIALWIVAGLLAAMNLLGGWNKITGTTKFRSSAPWTESVSDASIRAIGVVEIVGALGLILPQATGIAPILTPTAAIGLAIVQAVAIVVHVRRGETKILPMNIVLVLLAVFVAVGRLA